MFHTILFLFFALGQRMVTKTGLLGSAYTKTCSDMLFLFVQTQHQHSKLIKGLF